MTEDAAGTPETDRIERDLTQTRARLDATIDALQDKLSPGQMVDQAVSYLKESGGGDFGRNLTAAMRDNPIPVALVGIGLGWLVLSGNLRGGAGGGGNGGGGRAVPGPGGDRRPPPPSAGPGRVRVHGDDDRVRPVRPATSTPMSAAAPLVPGAAPGTGGPLGLPRADFGRVDAGRAEVGRGPIPPPYRSGYGVGGHDGTATTPPPPATARRRGGGKEEDGGLRERAGDALAATRDRASGLGRDMAQRGQSAMRNLYEYGREAAGDAYEYGREAAEEAYGYGRAAAEGAYDYGGDALRGVRDNPVPAVLIGLGVGWLLYSRLGGSGGGSGGPTRRPVIGTAGPAYPYGGGAYGGPARGAAAGGSYRPYRYDDPYRSYPGPGSDAAGAATAAPAAARGAYASAALDDAAGKADEAGRGVRREADESDDAYEGRIHAARGAVLGLKRSVDETVAGFRGRVDAAVRAAAEAFERVRAQATAAGESAARSAQGYGEAAYAYGQSAAEGAYGYGRSAVLGTARGTRDAADYVQRQPMLLGALGLALGAALAMLLPSTRYERDAARGLAGPLRERLGDAAAGVVEGATRVVEQVADAARESAEREGLADLSPDGLAASARQGVAAARQGIADAAGRVRNVVEDTAAAGRDALERELAGAGDAARDAAEDAADKAVAAVDKTGAGAGTGRG